MNFDLRQELAQIAGIGFVKAGELINAGIESIADLRRPSVFNRLSKETQLDVTYDVNRKLTWKFVDEFVTQLIKNTSSVMRHPFIGVGSYRRHRKECRDVDILTAEDMDRAAAELERICGVIGCKVLGKFVAGFQRSSYILEWKSTIFKVDLFHTHPSQFAAALLHYTGSKMFNIRCRLQAERKGYKLNDKGLWRHMILIPTKTEEDILKAIGVAYKSPEERDEQAKKIAVPIAPVFE